TPRRRNLEHALAAGVVGLELRGRRRAARVVRAKEAEDDRITRLAPGCGVEPPPQPRLLHVAELARDGDAPLVLGLGVDLDPVGAAELEPDACERGSGLGPEPGAGLRRADPVADLECALADPPVQTAPAGDFRLVAREEAE